MPESASLEQRYHDLLVEIERLSRITETHLDTECYRVYLATLWVNAVLDPPRAGLSEAELEDFFDLLNAKGGRILGEEEALQASFRYLVGRRGEQAMERLRLPAEHRRQLTRFAELMGVAPLQPGR